MASDAGGRMSSPRPALSECFVVLLLDTRRRVKGHQLVAIGAMDTLHAHPREVFRVAVISGAAAVVLLHNNPSGDPTPSEADIKVTCDLFLQVWHIDPLISPAGFGQESLSRRAFRRGRRAQPTRPGEKP